jgi:D-alanyl-D-alanine carboxypeptidase
MNERRTARTNSTSRTRRCSALTAGLGAALLVLPSACGGSTREGAARVTPASAHADAPTPAPTPALQRALDDVVAAGAPGAVVLVHDRDGTRTLASGTSDLGRSTPMAAAMATRIGGLTKSFTATVALQLVGEGRIGLDDPIERWLPGAVPGGAAISVRQLLNHTSGIADYASDPEVLAPYVEGDLTREFDLRHGLEVAIADGPQSAPGVQLGYSNTNTLLLSMIIEGVTGQPIGREIAQRVIVPLDLRHTWYATASSEPPPVHGYLLIDGELVDVTAFSPTLLGPAGAIVSNAEDVARFYGALLGGELLGRPELAAMKTIDPVATGGAADAGIVGGGWGLGLLRETFPCGEAWGHDGENPGYMTAAWSSEDGARQVVAIVNTRADHDEPVSGAMRALLGLGYCGAGA